MYSFQIIYLGLIYTKAHWFLENANAGINWQYMSFSIENFITANILIVPLITDKI